MTPPEGLSRVERLIRFIECLPITSGLLAGQTFGVRAWQRSILEGITGPIVAARSTERRPEARP